jgi:soluble cytochrome b562
MVEMNFIDIFNTIEKSKKLNFLKELLLKDSDLQQQFIEFSSTKEIIPDDKTAVDIKTIRDEIWHKISEIDANSYIESHCDYTCDDYVEQAEELLENIYNPYVQEIETLVRKGHYLDAFGILLAIYEVALIESPQISNDDYYVFEEGIAVYMANAISSTITTFNLTLQNKVLSNEITALMIKLFFQEVQKYQSYSDKEEANYNISDFQHFFEIIIQQASNAEKLLQNIEKYTMRDAQNIRLHCADISDNNNLYLTIANEEFRHNKELALKLQKRYKKLNLQNKLAEISQILLEKEHADDYAYFVIENIDKEAYKSLYIKALKIYIKETSSVKYYKILREYLSQSDRLKFIETLKDGFHKVFYINLLEIEKQYESILLFVEEYKDSYDLYELIKPIISIYPQRVFKIIKTESNKEIEYRSRSSYTRAAHLLQLMLGVSQVKDDFKSYISQLYNHQPRLPALQDELAKAGLL